VFERERPTHVKTPEAIEEHTYAKTVVQDLMNMQEDDELWQAMLAVLEEMVEYHIEEKEEQLFRQAKKVLQNSLRLVKTGGIL
jgi:3-phenylpropionate/cinnamic acid dioxygenase small subunit